MKYAHEINYWRTGKSSPDVWIERTKSVLSCLGAQGIAEAFGSANGRGAFFLSFTIAGESFRVVWPVMPTRDPSEESAARIQAATLLYHDCKAKAISAAVLGTRTVFFSALQLPDGRTMGELSGSQLLESIPDLKRLTGSK